MDEDKKAYIAGLFEKAESDLEDHIERQAELRERFESLKPEIEEVATQPNIEADDSLEALERRMEAFRDRAETCENLRHEVEDVQEDLISLIEGLTGEAGALSPVQNLERLDDDKELLEEAKRILERYQIYRYTRFDVLKESLQDTRIAVVELQSMYSEQASSIDEQLQSLRAESGTS